MRIKTRNKVEVAFSMSGMTDIVFLLLLFFMITSTMIAPNALKLLLPQLGKSTVTEQTVPEVILKGGGNVSVEGRSVSLEELGNILRRQLYGQTDPTIKLITSSDVTVKETVNVMNVAVRGNYKVVLVKQ
jgi:biopolymer transport protein ExbD